VDWGLKKQFFRTLVGMVMMMMVMMVMVAAAAAAVRLILVTVSDCFLHVSR